MSRKVWIVGPIAWDTVIYIDEFPAKGGFVQARRKIERVGGTAGNVAIALATADVDTGFVTYIGKDDFGAKIKKLLTESQISELKIKEIDDETSHVVVAIDKTGDRTIIGLNISHLNQVNLKDVPLGPTDIVCFVVWRDYFLESLLIAQKAGCTTVVGAEALEDKNVKYADIVIGSRAEYSLENDMSQYLDRFSRIVLTSGENGVHQYEAGKTTFKQALKVNAIDTTGAGDSFLAGYLAALAKGDQSGIQGIEAGIHWAALMVTKEQSIPPNWSEIPGHDRLL